MEENLVGSERCTFDCGYFRNYYSLIDWETQKRGQKSIKDKHNS